MMWLPDSENTRVKPAAASERARMSAPRIEVMGRFFRSEKTKAAQKP
jgi:hypothetical protein